MTSEIKYMFAKGLLKKLSHHAQLSETFSVGEAKDGTLHLAHVCVWGESMHNLETPC